MTNELIHMHTEEMNSDETNGVVENSGARRSKPADPAAWHREPCEVADWLVVSGDLPPDRDEAVALLERWVALGITDIIDVRDEWNDAEFVAELAPGITYHHLGTHDDGGWQDDHWFESGIAAARQVQARGGRAIVHCHMGVNRAPSMAFRLLLDSGHDPIEALEMIREARPIAAILYAEAAMSHYMRSMGAERHEVDRAKRMVNQWLTENRVDTYWVISRIRRAEG